MTTRTLILTGVATLITAQAAAAQAWDAPGFLPPGEQSNLGLYLIDPEASDFGVMGIWRRGGAITTIGLRAGVFAFDDAAFAVGADVSRLLLRAGSELPVDVAGTLGLGATFKDGTFARLPIGLSVGRRFIADDWAFVPYVHPRLGIDIVSSDDFSDSDLSFTTDIGADLHTGRNVMLRLGVAVGDHNAVGFGVAIRGTRLTGVAARP